MGFLSLCINLLISLSPATVIFTFIIAESSQLVILAMGGAFFWTIGILLYSALWVLIKPIQVLYFLTVPISVVVTEAARFVFWLVYDKVYNRGLLGDDLVRPTDFQVSIAAGWSFGVTQALLFHISVVFDGYGPGFIGFPTCDHISLFYVQSVTMLSLTIFQILIGILAFNAYKDRAIGKILIIVFTHIIYSSSSILNTLNLPCYIPIIVQYVITLLLTAYTWTQYKSIAQSEQNNKEYNPVNLSE